MWTSPLVLSDFGTFIYFHIPYLDGREEIIDNAADRFFLTQELSRIEKQSGVGAENVKQQILLIRTLANLSIIVPLIFLALLVLLALRSQMDFARWIGLPLVVGGVLALLPTLVYQPIIGSLLTLGPLSEVPAQVRAEFARSFGVLLAEAFNPMLVESLAIIVVGMAMVIVGILRKPKASPVVA